MVRQDRALLFEVVRNKLAAFVREKASQRLKPAADEAALADLCIASIQGALLLGKIRRDQRTVDLAIGQVLAHLSTFRQS